MSTLPPQLRIANTAAVCDGPYGAVTQHAKRSGVSRQTLYRDAPKVLQAVDGSDAQRRFQDLQDEIDRLRAERTTLRRQLQQAVLVDADTLAQFASIAQAEGVSLPVTRRLLAPLVAQSLADEPHPGSVCPVSPDSAAYRTPPPAARPLLLEVLDEFSRKRVESRAPAMRSSLDGNRV